LSTYREEWPCCGQVSITEAYIPSSCPFCGDPDTITIPRADLERLQRDAELWKQEHENLLSVRDADLAALSAKIDTYKKMLRICKTHIRDWWWNFGDKGSQLPPARSAEILEAIEDLLNG
jgi:hypothetical protein